jgi:peroxiredoxin
MKITPVLFALSLTLAVSSAPGESLKEQLDAKKTAFLEMAPPDKTKSYQDGIDTVAASGILDRALKPGDKAPDFELKTPEGKKVRLSELLKAGPIVVTWYRGGWCPYCNLTLLSLQKALPDIKAAGGQLIALNPELDSYTSETVGKTNIEFDVLSDPANNVAREYGIVFKMTPDVAAAMRKGVQTNTRNGDESDELPLAASYVIAQDGTITYAFLDADYRNRAEPSDLIQALQALQSLPKGAKPSSSGD